MKYQFRAKDIESGAWRYGNVFWTQGGNVAYIIPYCHLEDGEQVNVSTIMGYQVDPDTIGRCTDYYASDGKRLYEGDLVEGYCDGIFGDGAFGIIDCSGDTFFQNFYNPCHGFITAYREIRIVGNRFDNPDMLPKSYLHPESEQAQTRAPISISRGDIGSKIYFTVPDEELPF